MHRLLYGFVLLALAAVAVGAWLLPADQIGPPAPNTGPSAVAELPGGGLAPVAFDTLGDLTGRPPFAASRRAPSAAGDDSDLVLGRYRLSGVIVAPSRRAVILSAGAGSVTVSEGEQIDGWTVDEITPERVVLISDGRRQEFPVEAPAR